MFCKLRLARATKQIKFFLDSNLLLLKNIFGAVDVEVIRHISWGCLASRVDFAYVI